LQEVGSNSEPPETDPEGSDFDIGTSDTINTENASIDICQIGAIPFNSNAHQNGSEVFQISIEQIDRYLNKDFMLKVVLSQYSLLINILGTVYRSPSASYIEPLSVAPTIF